MAKVGGDRSKWVRSEDFARAWMLMSEEVQNDYTKLIAAFQAKWPQLTEDNIKTKMKTCDGKWDGLPPIVAKDRYTGKQLLAEFPGLTAKRKKMTKKQREAAATPESVAKAFNDITESLLADE